MVPTIIFPEGGFEYRVDEFDQVTFQCSAIGLPAPTISWFRDGTLLNAAYDSRIILGDPSVPIAFPTPTGDVLLVIRMLIFNDITDSDSGTYTCQATNIMAVSVTQDFELFVGGKALAIVITLRIRIIWYLFFAPVAPKILTPPKDLMVVQRQDATFSCLATANPRPDITWWRVREDGSLSRISLVENVTVIVEQDIGMRERNSTLTILGSLPSDAGEYVCRAGNGVNINETSVILIVYGT